MPRPRKTDTTHDEQPLLMNMHDFTPDPELNGYYCICQLPRQNRHHNDAFMGPAPTFPTPPAGTQSPYAPQAHPCARCGAQPGEPCHKTNPTPGTALTMHRERRYTWTAWMAHNTTQGEPQTNRGTYPF